MRPIRTLAFLAPLFLLSSAATVATAGTLKGPAAGLKIEVVEGEDGVNIIQQNTAVAPVVVVKDENDQPVAGAIVTFAIRSGRATFNGARTISVTTNAAGRAAVTGLTPTGPGTLQIGASASFQGQTAATTIAQTNVMTASEAASASSASGGSGGSSGAGGSAGGGGGGVSTTTIGAIAGAGAAGTIVAVKAAGGDSGSSGSGSSGSGSSSGQSGGSSGGGTSGSAAGTRTLSGPFSGSTTYAWSYRSIAGFNCSVTWTFSGTLTLTLTTSSSGAASGTLSDTRTTNTTSAIVCTMGITVPAPGGTGPAGTSTYPVSGTASSISAGASTTVNVPDPSFPSSESVVYAFTGSLANNVVTGTLRETITITGEVTGGWTYSIAVTLR